MAPYLAYIYFYPASNPFIDFGTQGCKAKWDLRAYQLECKHMAAEYWRRIRRLNETLYINFNG